MIEAVLSSDGSILLYNSDLKHESESFHWSMLIGYPMSCLFQEN